jgi:uncharacterized protein
MRPTPGSSSRAAVTIGFSASLLAVGLVAGSAYGQTPIAPPPSWSPVLDCQARVFAIDTLICDNSSLLASARRMEAAYAAARGNGASPDKLADDQQAWSKTRNLCAFDQKAARCVARLQNKRTKALERLVLSGPAG